MDDLYGGCIPVIAESLKNGKQFKCRVSEGEYCVDGESIDVYITEYDKTRKKPYKCISLTDEDDTYACWFEHPYLR